MSMTTLFRIAFTCFYCGAHDYTNSFIRSTYFMSMTTLFGIAFTFPTTVELTIIYTKTFGEITKKK